MAVSINWNAVKGVRQVFLRLASTIGASLVGYLQSGTGASTTRTVQDRLRETVSVMDFGAVGDGVTDDSTAFSNAVATGKSIFVPKGTYLISSGFTLSDDQLLYGQGSQSVLRYTGSLRCVALGNRSRVRSIKVVGDGKAAGKTLQTGIFAFAVVGWSIDDCEVTDISGNGQTNGGGGILITALSGGNTEGGRINGCRCNNNNTGISFEDRGEYVVTSNCLVSANTTGIYAAAGNLAINNCNLQGNVTNLKLRTGTNDGHGFISNCLINHGSTFNLDVNGLVNGMSFENCGLYNGPIQLDSCTGIRFINCDIVGFGRNFTLANTVTRTLIMGCRFPKSPTGTAMTLVLNANTITEVSNFDF